MRHLLVLLFSLALVTPAWAQDWNNEDAPSSSEPEEGVVPKARHPVFILNLGGGMPLSPADNQVQSQFTHNPWASYMFTTGGYYVLPFHLREVFFFGGGDFNYIYSTELLNSQSGASTLATTMYQLLLTGGMAYQPSFLGGRWGVYGFASYEVWGQKQTLLDTSGFNRSFATRPTDVPLPLGIGVYFRITNHFRPYFNYRYSFSVDGGAGLSIITLGLQYGF
jgi:hypothetical protein